MSNNDSPAGTAGGPVPLPGLGDLPEKLRVHALAKLLGRTSREVMAALPELGFEARSVAVERRPQDGRAGRRRAGAGARRGCRARACPGAAG